MITKNRLKWLARFVIGVWLICLLTAVFLSGAFSAFYFLPTDSRLELGTVFASLTAEMRFSYSNLRIEDNPYHYGYSHIAAHCHLDTREICVKPESLDNQPEVIWHEVAHTLHLVLNGSASDFEQKWKSVGGGCLTDYGAKNEQAFGEERGRMEDIAQCVKFIYCEAHGFDSEWQFAPEKHFRDPSSSHFRKINLLLEYHVFSQEVYDRSLARLK